MAGHRHKGFDAMRARRREADRQRYGQLGRLQEAAGERLPEPERKTLARCDRCEGDTDAQVKAVLAAGWELDVEPSEDYGEPPAVYWTRRSRKGERKISGRAHHGFVVPAGVFVKRAASALAYDRGEKL